MHVNFPQRRWYLLVNSHRSKVFFLVLFWGYTIFNSRYEFHRTLLLYISHSICSLLIIYGSQWPFWHRYEQWDESNASIDFDFFFLMATHTVSYLAIVLFDLKYWYELRQLRKMKIDGFHISWNLAKTDSWFLRLINFNYNKFI